MRVVFMGTPDFRCALSGAARFATAMRFVPVYTQPDKPKGRGHKLQPPPVKELALRHNIPVFQPVNLRGEDTQREIQAWGADVIVVVAYGKLLPKAVLDAPELGCVNVHGSLLPKYRGAAPIQWTVLNGDKTAGVTTMFMAEGMDTGDMLLKAETPVGEEETSGQLFDRLKDLGAQLLIETLEKLEQGALTPIPQEEAQATHAPMLSKELSLVDWTKPAHQVHDLIRGPEPLAFRRLLSGREKAEAPRLPCAGGQRPARQGLRAGGRAAGLLRPGRPGADRAPNGKW